MKKLEYILVFLFFCSFSVSAQTSYVLIGWNDLGMHCDNKTFAKVAVLPPYNNVYAQLIEKVPGQNPQIVTTGITISYSIPGNSYSVGKTDFWTYAQQLFGLSTPLPPNIGLTGKGLTGALDPAPNGGNFFFARGIPITPFTDADLTHENPFQLIHLVATITGTNTVLATTDCVIPVSNDMSCVSSGCHTSEQDILNRHEGVNGFNRNGPVMCANCHADNALGTTGRGEAPIFSEAMHSKHAELGLPNTAATCYKCHPGSQAQCLRGAMVDSPPPATPMICQDCHGTLSNVASTIRQGRRPWLDEPECGTCHGSNFASEPGKLFKDSQGHGGLFCEACHGSTHGLYPARNANDNVQSIQLQGMPGIIRRCTTCHSTVPTGPGPHGIMGNGTPPMISVTSPANGSNVSTGSNVIITANATDADGTISAVQFFQGTALLGGALNPPYSFTWNNVAAGNYSITAVALDNGRMGTQSMPISLMVGGGGGNQPPSVSITSPANGSSFTAGSNITINATASDPDGTVSSVAFYRGTTLLGTSTTPPYSFTWANVPAGSYTLTAIATDNGGLTATSPPININVSTAGNIPPTVSITSPSNGATFTEGSNIIIRATATDADGTVSRVEFYQGTTLLGADTTAPYSFTWNNVSAGSYSLTAVAMDNGGAKTTSSAVNITINEAPENMPPSVSITSPRDGSTFNYRADITINATASDADGSVTQVSFYRGDHLLGTDTRAPYSFRWNNVPSGRYTLTAVATDNDGASTTSSTVQITVRSRRGDGDFALSNFPNPFNPSTQIEFTLPDEENVTLKIYNMLGQEVAVLVNNERMAAGDHTIHFAAANLVSGTYICELKAGNSVQVKKIVFLK